jgi:hypothetical protein
VDTFSPPPEHADRHPGTVSGSDGEPEVSPPPAQLALSRNPVVQKFVPPIASFLLHAALILLGVLTYKVIEHAVAPVQEQIVIPEATIVTPAPVTGTGGPSPWDDPHPLAAAQDEFETATADSWSNVPTESLTRDLGGGESSLIALGPNRGFGQGTGSLGTGSGEAGLGRFGVPGGGGGSGGSPVFPERQAGRIIYLCDATGTMMDKFHALQLELFKAVEALQPVQAFNVIFFHDGSQATAADRSRSLMATAQNKRKAIQFIEEMFVFGQTDPIPALRMAFAQQPEVIYFLTDGAFDNLVSDDEVYEEIKRLNSAKRVRINTVAFLDRDPQWEAWMQRVAAENGGTYRLITWEDLRR